jgi:translation initiation factor IF-1
MMKQVQRVILIVRLHQALAVPLDLVHQQVGEVQKRVPKVVEVQGDQEGRKRKGTIVIVTGDVVVVVTVSTRSQTKC